MDELETMTANLKKAQGLIADVLHAAEKLPAGETADDFYQLVESLTDYAAEALTKLEYMAHVARMDGEGLSPFGWFMLIVGIIGVVGFVMVAGAGA